MTQAEAASPGTFRTSGARLDLDRLPGPAPMRLLGSYGNMVQFFLDPIGYLDTLVYGGHGDLAIFARGMGRGLVWPAEKSQGAVFAIGANYNQQVLIKHATFPESVVARMPPDSGGAARLTSGLLWMQGEKHRQHRRLVTPLYHQKRIEGYRDLMVATIGRALDRFTPGACIDVMNETGRLLIEFQNKVVLGIDEVQDGKGSLGERMATFYDLMGSPAALIPINLPHTPRRKLLDIGDSISRDLDTLISKKRAAKEEATDVLSMMIQSRYDDGTALTQDELVAETLQLFIAGWVSTRSAVAWTTFLLAQHPKVSADLHDEISSALHGDAPTVEQLRQLPMLDWVLKESLRLFPPIYIVSRAPTEAVELGGYRLPARTELYLSIYHTHRQPDLYPEPKRFLPERWKSLDPGPYAYLPFGIGSRTCPGLALATMQMKILLAMLVQRYRLEMPRGAKLDRSGVGGLFPKPGVRLRVRTQDRRFSESRGAVRGNVTEMVDLDV